MLEKALDKASAEPPTRLFSIRHDFATAWAAFIAAPAGAASYTLELDFSRFIPPSRTTEPRRLSKLSFYFIGVADRLALSIGTSRPAPTTATSAAATTTAHPADDNSGRPAWQSVENIEVNLGSTVTIAMRPVTQAGTASAAPLSAVQLAALHGAHAFAFAAFGD